MLTILTGTGLSAAAGLNAYIPLLMVGLLARFTDLLPLGPGWAWLEHPVTLVVLGVLLAVEFFADKIPVVDSINDAVQTFVRPTSGGITFGAGASSVTLQEVATAADATTRAADTGGGDASFWPIVAGALVALVLHVVKSLARPLINAISAGVGGAVASVAEDFSSLTIAVLAILVPFVILVLVPLFVVLVVWLVRARRRRKREKAARAQEGGG